MKRRIKKGMTLIEIIISIALLGILAVSFLTLFTIGFSGIAAAGNRSKATYNTQTKIEQDLYGSVPAAGSDKLAISFQDNPSDRIEVQGSVKTENAVVNGKRVDITFFMPNR